MKKSYSKKSIEISKRGKLVLPKKILKHMKMEGNMSKCQAFYNNDTIVITTAESIKNGISDLLGGLFKKSAVTTPVKSTGVGQSPKTPEEPNHDNKEHECTCGKITVEESLRNEELAAKAAISKLFRNVKEEVRFGDIDTGLFTLNNTLFFKTGKGKTCVSIEKDPVTFVSYVGSILKCAGTVDTKETRDETLVTLVEFNEHELLLAIWNQLT